MRYAEIAKLDNEIDVCQLHRFDESLKTLMAIMHDILMHIGDDAKANRLTRVDATEALQCRWKKWECCQHLSATGSCFGCRVQQDFKALHF